MPVRPSPFRGDAAPSLSRERERVGVRGLSLHTESLWLAAIRYRKLADTLASESRTPAP